MAAAQGGAPVSGIMERTPRESPVLEEGCWTLRRGRSLLGDGSFAVSLYGWPRVHGPRREGAAEEKQLGSYESEHSISRSTWPVRHEKDTRL